MTPLIATIVGTLGSVLVKMLMQLLTEKFLKEVIVHGLEAVARTTANTVDDDLVKAAKEAWLPAEEKKDGGE